jgi:hypothetical protein
VDGTSINARSCNSPVNCFVTCRPAGGFSDPYPLQPGAVLARFRKGEGAVVTSAVQGTGKFLTCIGGGWW